ncbi:TPA: hypothetical protein I6Z04_003634 [Vibrio cholerae]|nr:hypothetical protein [Vibrio cholerae]HAS3169818.1 hypothetical protein [Vibrio cholerae]
MALDVCLYDAFA